MSAGHNREIGFPRAPVYDAFMSYRHAADGLLAPRLQAGLQRFAKPWWKLRALRTFRDEASLSANPHLWSSITAALDRSGWFVVLLSAEAAASAWVNKAIEYWPAPPADPRLDTLQEFCSSGECFRDAQFVHPTQRIRTPAWNAYAPFHISGR